MFNKNDWSFARPAIPAGCAGVCFTNLLRAHNATEIFSTCAYMGAERCIVVVGEPNTKAEAVQLVYVANHRAKRRRICVVGVAKHI